MYLRGSSRAGSWHSRFPYISIGAIVVVDMTMAHGRAGANNVLTPHQIREQVRIRI